MNENKDLEIIKDRIQTIIHQEYLHVTGAAYLEEILSSAEQMAAYIEHQKKMIDNFGVEITRLKAELEKCKEKIHHLYDINSELAQANSDTNFQLNFFKAELAGRPEVVMCGDCKHKEWCRKSINQDGHGDMCPVSFCSAGQRKESEVKDGKE